MASKTSICSAANNHGPTETSSRCATDTATATHNFEVTGFSLLDGMGTGKFVTSSTFRVGGRGWNIKLYPDGWKEDDGAGYVSVFLCLVDGAPDARVKYTLNLLDKHGQVASSSQFKEVSTTLKSIDAYWGYPKFVEKSKLRSELPCRNDDCFTIRCTLTVIGLTQSDEVVTSIVKAFPRNNFWPASWLLSFLQACCWPSAISRRRCQAALPGPGGQQASFEQMLKDGKGADVTFGVEGQLFRAHRCVLAARSPVFDAQFFGPVNQRQNASSSDHIQIDDMEPFVFESLLHFVYTDRIKVDKGRADKNNVLMIHQHLLVAADRYGLDSLKAMCEAELCHSVDVHTVGTTLALAEQHQCLRLKDACTTFIASSRGVLGAVLETDGFKHFIESCPFAMKDILHKIAKNNY
ncbi:hypothetical protein PR202_gb14317 [Eleusine coracana subsp. coracana]|uniref:Uncharacterized protein n=1 Tax=Eleusine coracana subsp. coracana TaxID=191504 RepID=A0AAV5EUQ6_ELECO|nr:hypothetical protein QOZ80_4BG0334180 [Eleusine coracana subsp. coracana]GJN26390.1 hypothetical protein PR202_gb14317 [Eleusine coracana subsp. coracana]